MLVNNSYKDPELKKILEEQVGKPYNLMERIKLGGIGSPKLNITGCSKEINDLFKVNTNRDTCNIELRPKGILVGFGVRLQTYLLIIPFDKLVILEEKSEEYSIHKDHYFIRFSAKKTEMSIHKFLKKLIYLKANFDKSNAEV